MNPVFLALPETISAPTSRREALPPAAGDASFRQHVAASSGSPGAPRQDSVASEASSSLRAAPSAASSDAATPESSGQGSPPDGVPTGSSRSPRAAEPDASTEEDRDDRAEAILAAVALEAAPHATLDRAPLGVADAASDEPIAPTAGLPRRAPRAHATTGEAPPRGAPHEAPPADDVAVEAVASRAPLRVAQAPDGLPESEPQRTPSGAAPLAQGGAPAAVHAVARAAVRASAPHEVLPDVEGVDAIGAGASDGKAKSTGTKPAASKAAAPPNAATTAPPPAAAEMQSAPEATVPLRRTRREGHPEPAAGASPSRGREAPPAASDPGIAIEPAHKAEDSDHPREAATLSPGNRTNSGTTRAAQADAEPPALRDVERTRLVQRVARAFQHVDREGGSVRIRLSPPELGSLRIELSVHSGVMAARLEADNPLTRSLLLEHLPSLRERLAEQQIRVERFDVDLSQRDSSGGSQAWADQHPSARWQRPLPRGARRPAGAARVEESAVPRQRLVAGRFNVLV